MTIPGANLGSPTGAFSTTNTRLLGTVQLGIFIYAFVLVKTSSGTSLYMKWQENDVWATAWYPLNAPAAGISFDNTYQGTVLTDGVNIWVFVCGADNNIYFNLFNGVWGWSNALPQPSSGATSYPIQFLDVATPAPQFGFFAKANDAAWFAAPAPDAVNWVWLPATNYGFSTLTNAMLRLNADPTSKIKFQIDANGHLICGIGGENVAKTKARVEFKNRGAFVTKFKVKWRNPDGTQGETAQSMGGEVGHIDVINLADYDIYIKAGADCWGEALISFGPAHESGSNFTYDPSQGIDVVRYEISGGTQTASFTDATVGPFIDHGYKIPVTTSQFVQFENNGVFAVSEFGVYDTEANKYYPTSGGPYYLGDIASVDLSAFGIAGRQYCAYCNVILEDGYLSEGNFVFDPTSPYAVMRYEVTGFAKQVNWSSPTSGPFINH